MRRDATLAPGFSVNDTALTEKAGDPAWHQIQSYFVVAGKDKNIPVAAQKWMAERAHWCTILVSVAVRLLMHPRCRWAIALLA